MRIVLFRGFGWDSSLAEREAREAARTLASMGLPVELTIVTVPALDEEGVTPSVLVEGREVHAKLHAILDAVVEAIAGPMELLPATPTHPVEGAVTPKLGAELGLAPGEESSEHVAVG